MYNLSISKKAQKFISKQDKNTKQRIKESLLKLAENPYKKGTLDIKPLQGNKDQFRLRVGDLRILYTIDNGELIILILKIDSRGDIYKRL